MYVSLSGPSTQFVNQTLESQQSTRPRYTVAVAMALFTMTPKPTSRIPVPMEHYDQSIAEAVAGPLMTLNELFPLDTISIEETVKGLWVHNHTVLFDSRVLFKEAQSEGNPFLTNLKDNIGEVYYDLYLNDKRLYGIIKGSLRVLSEMTDTDLQANPRIGGM